MNSVVVFMSTYNGSRYVKEQIDSILSQQGVDVKLVIRDDGSADNTNEILKEYGVQHRIVYYRGQNIGYRASFLDLINQDVFGDYYAFADQDDVWKENKLIEAVKKLNKIDNKKKLYASSLERVNEKLEKLSEQSFCNLRLTLGAEMTRHRLAGCTMVFSSELRDIMRKALLKNVVPCSHDRLATILCLACGGEILFDNKSYILFRRTSNNTSIDSKGIINKIKCELDRLGQNKDKYYNMAKTLNKIYNDEYDMNARKFLYDIEVYKDSVRAKIRLLFSRKIDCGFWYYNLFTRFLILINKY